MDQDVLVSEIRQLRKMNRRWKNLAIAASFLAFVAMLPFTVAVNEIASYFQWKQREQNFEAIQEEFFHAARLVKEPGKSPDKAPDKLTK